jgi:hypothetical protein
MSEHKKYIKYVDSYYKLSEDINFNSIFDSLMEFCLQFNRYKFGKNYSNSKCFVHIRGGSSIKYKMNRYGLLDNNITNDVDIIIVPFENNPNIRIKLIEEFAIALKKAFPKYMWRYTIENLLTRFYINNFKIFDIVFYDMVKPWFKNFENDALILGQIMNRLNKYKSVDNYFNNLKKLFESKLENQEILEKVTFTSFEYEYQSLKLLINYYEKKYIEDVKKLKEENATPKEIYEYKKKNKNKIGTYKKKLFYLTYIMVNNNF